MPSAQSGAVHFEGQAVFMPAYFSFPPAPEEKQDCQQQDQEKWGEHQQHHGQIRIVKGAENGLEPVVNGNFQIPLRKGGGGVLILPLSTFSKSRLLPSAPAWSHPAVDEWQDSRNPSTWPPGPDSSGCGPHLVL